MVKMSFLGDLVDSIGTDKSSIAPPKPFQRQTVSSTVVKPKSIAKSLQVSIPPSSPQLHSKRKLEESDTPTAERLFKTSPASALTTKNDSRPSTPKISDLKLSQSKSASRPQTPPNAPQAKIPPKGSYADIMARAKQAQEQRPSSKVGQIKHQATSKEKVSKVAERRREEQERMKIEKTKAATQAATQAGSRDRTTKKRSVSPAKREQPSAPKAPRPPMHAPPGYKGTLGTSSKRSRHSDAGRAPKRSRRDEYLGTDEDEDSEVDDYDDGYGYGSDQSSDMEAGWDELEGEEATALRAARQDDATELALENRLKTEKEERRRRLAAMARKAR